MGIVLCCRYHDTAGNKMFEFSIPEPAGLIHRPSVALEAPADSARASVPELPAIPPPSATPPPFATPATPVGPSAPGAPGTPPVVAADKDEPAKEEAPSPPEPEFRTWRAATGKFKVVAQFLSLTDEKVRLRKRDEEEVEIRLELLSQPDREYVAKAVATAPSR